MKIEKLMIYGYGKFENQTIEFTDSKLQIIYGENEAGKSTIMSFIHSILFGFPTKQQTGNRYEPKRGSAYGGYLMIRTEENQQLKIERRPGKAGGEVIVELEGGTVQKEEYLQTILGGIDLETYKSIFSFDIHGLQQIHKMNSDQIGKFLFLSSIYGAEALFTIEHTLIKQQDMLFKPSGKRPVLNEALSKLKESNRQLLEAKGKNNEYQQLLTEKDSLKERLLSLDLNKKQQITKQKKLEKVKAILPLIRERNWCVDQLSLLPDTTGFPEDGLQQLDQFVLTLQPMEAQLHSLRSKNQQYEVEAEELTVNHKVLTLLPTIHSIREQLPLYKEKKHNEHLKEQRIEQLKHEINLYKQRLYPQLNDEEVSKIHATVPIKESIKKALADDQHLNQRKKMVDEQFEQAKKSLEETEWKISDLQKNVLSAEERKALENEVSRKEALNPAHIKAEHQQILSQIQGRRREHKKEKKQRVLLVGGLALLLLIGSCWFISEQDWLISGILIIGLIVALLQLKRVITKEDPLIDHLTSRQKILEQEIISLKESGEDYQSLSELMKILDKDNKIIQALHHEQLLHKQHERTYDRVLKLYEEWEDDYFKSTESSSRLAKLLQLEKSTTPDALLEAFDLLQHIQQIMLKRQQNLAELLIINQEIVQYENTVNETLQACGLEKDSIEEAVYELFKLSSLEVEKNDQLLKIMDRKSETEEAIDTLTNKMNFLKDEKEELLIRVGVENEDEFRKMAKNHLKREELTKQKMWVEKQLTTEMNVNLETIPVDEYEDIDEKLFELEKVIEFSEQDGKKTQQEYSSVLHKINEIEQSGTYSKLRHATENEKAVVREYAEQWVVRALAKDLLNQTVERHREVRLPALLAYIEKYFKKLTSNKYKHVFLPNNKQSFIVERSDGMRFFAEELSQATAEQLYLSIRLALVKTINEQFHLPIMIDDSFVHFDHHRTANIMQLLQELKQDNQVIYFTCHQHISKTYHSNNMVNLSELYVG
ncbi:ATP-binding protein [Metabacillus elymi]|uniref:AAA family ATPase n=1 Tax=Metabacillus elymi TaxID=2745198 RepID=A0ABX6S3Y1_9BACI|nr:AAA family ATPase [Metabacillus sp. KUDC1714]QNF28277.1 AAA family ATPase [Metabacillus sp. KUDC1714]